MSESLYQLRMKKPYVVLVDPASGRGAPYNGQHKLMAQDASTELLLFALEKHVKAEDWDDALDAHFKRQRAGWMPEGSLAGWRLYWLRDGSTPNEVVIAATPDA